MTGIVEFQIKGVKRGLHFGPYAMLIAAKEDKCNSVELIEKVFEQQDPLSYLHFLYGCAVAWCKKNDKEVDFCPEDMMEWQNEIGGEKLGKMIAKAFKSAEPKNSPSPQETGSEVLLKT